MRSESRDVSQRARYRIALRLLPFVFLIYIVNYIDRVNVSFANLRMSADLGFSDKVYGLGVGMFYLTYVLFEIPGALIAERWSARKWIGRIMISWGIITIFTGFVRTAHQFYAARFVLGIAESSFFPAMIVYLTHWFCMRDRSRSVACLYSAIPVAALVGAPVAGWLLGVHWLSLAGWRWLFVLEGIPAIVLGVVTVFYLTDWPSQARWLPQDEREWLVNQLREELQAKKKIRDYTIRQAFTDRRVLLLTIAWFLVLSGILGNTYWVPTFLRRLTGFPTRTVTSLLMISAAIGFAITLLNGWHADKSSERRWHAAIPITISGFMYVILLVAHDRAWLAVPALLLGTAFFYGFYPCFWAIPTAMLSESAAAATFGLINSIGQFGGFAGPYIIGYLNDRTHSLAASFAYIALSYIASGCLILTVKAGRPEHAAQTLETAAR